MEKKRMDETRMRFVLDFRKKAVAVAEVLEGMTLGEMLYWVMLGEGSQPHEASR